MQSNNKKICLVVSSLGKGGAQHAAALQSTLLAKLGYNVHIVTVFNEVLYNYSGTLFNLGNYKTETNSVTNRLARLFMLRKYLKSENFDVIIDHRSRVQGYREFLITKFLYQVPTVYVIHSYQKTIMFPKQDWLSRLLYKNEVMVGVSAGITRYFKSEYQLKSIQTIYNAFNFEDIQRMAQLPLNNPLLKTVYILFYGRLDLASKNLTLLIDAYQASKLPKNNVKLVLLGSGPDQARLKSYVANLDLQDMVLFLPQTANPYPYVKEAKFTVLTSHYEGFPLVIPESLCLGTPVISVNCKTGPDEIIRNKFNGLLVPNYNVEALANAMNSFIFDEVLYTTCKTNAPKSVAPFAMAQIAHEWEHLLNKIA
ncbi:glycosyltransferase [Bizionia sediminis]|uniref:Glycosyltransferase n=1 Tax=Bizionia sediminis TaxID=1737064 RepID=A0ABW5KVT6_9FLAO